MTGDPGLARLWLRTAVDCAGAGIATLAHMIELPPDFVKLAIEMAPGIDQDLLPSDGSGHARLLPSKRVPAHRRGRRACKRWGRVRPEGW
ncbi:MAG TPA: hypothetical protein VNH20_10225 [Candidatus Dormibacteraeota bacterium]|nr:hypothetical protein [Candidatus Dormibacteraeota bacterium]